MKETLLEIKDLFVEYHSMGEKIYAVNGVDLTVREGETVGLVGETGAGKTTLAMAVMRLLQERSSRIRQGEIFFHGEDILRKKKRQMRLIRGDQISMIFQDPMTSLNPVLSVGDQIEEAIRLHSPQRLTKEERMRRTEEVLEMVGIPGSRGKEFPHQFSGGMKQRVVIAIALACRPELLIADEPTTALDVTIQAQVLNLIKSLKDQMGMSVLLITHDLGVVARTCDSVAVMYAGEIVEYGSVHSIFGEGAHHPYLSGLMGSIPGLAKEERLHPIEGRMPDPAALPEGCYFADRCPYAEPECRLHKPEPVTVEGHMIRCGVVRR